MAKDSEELFRIVTERLAKVASPKTRSVTITMNTMNTMNTEIYRDLGVFGDEIVDLLVWLSEEFGIAGATNPFLYAPREFPCAFPFSAWFRTARRAVGMGDKPHCESLKVRDLIATIEAKRWPDEPSV